jgi:hypothetical protein
MTDTTEAPVGVVVNIEAQTASDARGMLAVQIAAATEAGDIAKVQTLAEQLAALLEEQGDLVTAPIETITELTADEVAAVALVREEGLAQAKAAKAGQVQAAIDATNSAAIEALLAGGQLTKAQQSYRDSLQALFPEIAAATDLGALDEILIPAQPE